jgi:hypothetical protein
MRKPDGKNAPLLSEANADFVRRRTSINVAARDAQNRPAVARALGCLVSGDRRRVTVFLSATHAAQVLCCLQENGAIAVAITRPTTHETLQIKGRVVGIVPLSDADRAVMAAYRESVIEELSPLGYRPEFVQTLLAGSDDGVAVGFEPTALFNQTPGPKAGEKLEALP